MPSPFPGMDPWLEDPAIFSDLHNALISRMGDVVNQQLPQPYYATSGSRVWGDVSLRYIEPDVSVSSVPTHKSRRASGGKKPGQHRGVATVPLRLRAPRVIEHDETSEWYLEIFANRGREQLVTIIEVLSISNKKPGRKGRELYLKKQSEILRKKVNLVEIDLLRGGEHTTAVPRDLVRGEFGAFDYHVSVRAIDEADDFLIYPWKLESPLPRVGVPLLPGDPDIIVDLQALLDECYDVRNYDRRVDYQSEKPKPPLTKRQKEWADRILAARRK